VSSPSDAEVIGRSLDEPEAFGLIYDRYAPTLLRFLGRCASGRPSMAPYVTVTGGRDGATATGRGLKLATLLTRWLIVNGQLEVWNAESGELLGRTDPYVPMNIDIGGIDKNLDQNIVRLEAEEQRRLAGNAESGRRSRARGLERNPTQLPAHAPPKRNAGLRVAP
jgi:hypothetical protein